jgi:ribonuclease HI
VNLQSTNSPSFSIYVDVGCCVAGSTVWGLVLRNTDGKIVLSACKKEEIVVEPIMAEVLGVRWAIQVVSEQGINFVSILSYAANVVNCVNKRSSFASINLIAQDCKDLLDRFDSASIMFVSRSQNGHAHNLASLAKIVGNRCVTMFYLVMIL